MHRLLGGPAIHSAVPTTLDVRWPGVWSCCPTQLRSVASVITVWQVGELPRVTKLNSVYTSDGDGGDADVGVRWVWEGC